MKPFLLGIVIVYIPNYNHLLNMKKLLLISTLLLLGACGEAQRSQTPVYQDTTFNLSHLTIFSVSYTKNTTKIHETLTCTESEIVVTFLANDNIIIKVEGKEREFSKRGEIGRGAYAMTDIGTGVNLAIMMSYSEKEGLLLYLLNDDNIIRLSNIKRDCRRL